MTLTGTDAAGNSVTNHATTDANGKYNFLEKPGTYTVTLDATNFTGGGALVGYTPTLTGDGTAATDSNASPSGTTPVALPEGTSDLTIDFGVYQPVKIGDFVWNDVNGNGVQDAGEAAHRFEHPELRQVLDCESVKTLARNSDTNHETQSDGRREVEQ